MNINFHYTDSYILNPLHPVTVNVIGCGGTGSHVLTGLGRLNEALVALGHLGLYVTVFDPDEVTEANLGRQMFSPADLGMNKAITMVTRVNRFFGTEWRAIPELYNRETLQSNKWEMPCANVTFSCVDSIKSRKEILKTFHPKLRRKLADSQPYARPIYWMDFGNTQKDGQVILSTVSKILQPSPNAIGTLPNIFKLFPKLKSQEEDVTTPSCSQRDSLKKQDLFINSTIAQYGLNIFWEMFRDFKIQHQGAFINLKTLRTNPISI